MSAIKLILKKENTGNIKKMNIHTYNGPHKPEQINLEKKVLAQRKSK